MWEMALVASTQHSTELFLSLVCTLNLLLSSAMLAYYMMTEIAALMRAEPKVSPNILKEFQVSIVL